MSRLHVFRAINAAIAPICTITPCSAPSDGSTSYDSSSFAVNAPRYTSHSLTFGYRSMASSPWSPLEYDGYGPRRSGKVTTGAEPVRLVSSYVSCGWPHSTQNVSVWVVLPVATQVIVAVSHLSGFLRAIIASKPSEPSCSHGSSPFSPTQPLYPPKTAGSCSATRRGSVVRGCEGPCCDGGSGCVG